MSTTKRLYEKNETKLNVPPSVTPSVTVTVTPSITPSISVTPSVTPSITATPSVTITPSATPSITPTISITPSITPSITVSVTPSPSSANYYVANIYNCNNGYPITCGQFTGQTTIYTGANSFIIGHYYTGSTPGIIYQPVDVTSLTPGSIPIQGGNGYITCTLACSSSYN